MIDLKNNPIFENIVDIKDLKNIGMFSDINNIEKFYTAKIINIITGEYEFFKNSPDSLIIYNKNIDQTLPIGLLAGEKIYQLTYNLKRCVSKEEAKNFNIKQYKNKDYYQYIFRPSPSGDHLYIENLFYYSLVIDLSKETLPEKMEYYKCHTNYNYKHNYSVPLYIHKPLIFKQRSISTDTEQYIKKSYKKLISKKFDNIGDTKNLLDYNLAESDIYKSDEMLYLKHAEDKINILNSISDSQIELAKGQALLRHRYIKTIYERIEWFLKELNSPIYFIKNIDKYEVSFSHFESSKKIARLENSSYMDCLNKAALKQTVNKKLTKKEELFLRGAYIPFKNDVYVIKLLSKNDSLVDINLESLSILNLDIFLTGINRIIFDTLEKKYLLNEQKKSFTNIVDKDKVINGLNELFNKNNIPIKVKSKLSVNSNAHIPYTLFYLTHDSDYLDETVSITDKLKELINLFVRTEFNIPNLSWDKYNCFYKLIGDKSVFN